MEECKNCKYKDNCKIGLYMVAPCDCEERVYRDPVDVFAPVIRLYQNAITGDFEKEPLQEYYKLNPFMYPF